MPEIQLKNQFSCAHDVLVDYFVDSERKEVRLRMQSLSYKDLISTGLLGMFVTEVLPREGIVAYHDDNSRSWNPIRSEWSLVLKFAGLALPVQAIRQPTLGDGREQFTFEIGAPR
jgi:hypothetical protein